MAALAFAPAALAPCTARAAACCGAGHGIGQRLSDAEDAALAAVVRGSTRVASWGSERDLRFAPAGTSEHELRAEIGWLVRVRRRVQLGVTLPLVYAYRKAGELGSSGGGVGDITATGQVDVLPRAGGSPWLPGVALTLAVLVPTGLPASASDDVLGADATGLGAGEIKPGVTLEKVWSGGWSATAAFSIGVRTASAAQAGLPLHLAPRWQVLVAAGPSWNSGLSFAIGVLHEREAAPSIGGVASPAAARERTATISYLAYDASSRWTVSGGAELDAPLPGLGRNDSVSLALSIGLRRVWGVYD